MPKFFARLANAAARQTAGYRMQRNAEIRMAKNDL